MVSYKYFLLLNVRNIQWQMKVYNVRKAGIRHIL